MYKRQEYVAYANWINERGIFRGIAKRFPFLIYSEEKAKVCLLYTSDAADERSSVDLGGRRIIKKKKQAEICKVNTILETREQKSD